MGNLSLFILLLELYAIGTLTIPIPQMWKRRPAEAQSQEVPVLGFRPCFSQLQSLCGNHLTAGSNAHEFFISFTSY